MRETQNYQTPSGKAFVLHTYLTAREVREIENAPMQHIKVGFKEQEAGPGGKVERTPDIKEYDTAAVSMATDDMLIKKAVISFDGSDQDILTRILDGKSEDYKFILARARDLIADPNKAK